MDNGKKVLIALLWFFAIAFILLILVGSCVAEFVDDDDYSGRGYYGGGYWGGGLDIK